MMKTKKILGKIVIGLINFDGSRNFLFLAPIVHYVLSHDFIFIRKSRSRGSSYSRNEALISQDSFSIAAKFTTFGQVGPK